MMRGTEQSAEEVVEGPDGRLRSWLRERDRMGALSDVHAALDDALARGYAQGLEQAREENLDRLRTILVQLLEARFGEVVADLQDVIEGASAGQLEKWIVGVLAATSAAEVVRV